MPKPKGLVERLRDGETVICGEGYMWELERRGYIPAGAFTPQVVLDHPQQVINLHEEYVHAGSDVVEAFTYYGNRDKLRVVGRETDLESLNMNALRMAREVADRTGTLMAGNICNTTTYEPDDPASVQHTKAQFKEQVEWAVKAGADFMIGETYNDLSEAKLALEAIKTYGKGMPAVIMITIYCPDTTTDDVPAPQALRELEMLGADVVGINCSRGPATLLPLLREARKACKGPLAALPVPFRTTEKEKTFFALTDRATGKYVYPLDLNTVQCSRGEIREFAEQAREIGVQFVGLCCGSSSNCLRELAEAYGRTPPSSNFRPMMSKNHAFGDNVQGKAKKSRDYMLGQY